MHPIFTGLLVSIISGIELGAVSFEAETNRSSCTGLGRFFEPWALRFPTNGYLGWNASFNTNVHLEVTIVHLELTMMLEARIKEMFISGIGTRPLS